MTIDDRPQIPTHIDDLTDSIQQLLNDVRDPDITIGTAADGYSKCAEALWMIGYLAFEYAANELGVTGFQHGYSRLKLLGQLANYEGPYMVLDGRDALYPQSDLPSKVTSWTNSNDFRQWAANEARKRLTDRSGAHSAVIAHWEKLAAATPATTQESPRS